VFEFFRRNRQTNQTEKASLPARSISSLIRSLFSNAINLEEIEDTLIRADFGVEASEQLAGELKTRAKRIGAESEAELRVLLKELLVEKLTREDSALNLQGDVLPHVILVVGVNGAGKTTTIGKLAKWFTDGSWKVVVGAADTFRAAAVDQLKTWADRAKAEIVLPENQGQDPAAVAYQAVARAIAEQADLVIIDTAGRLQNKKDLMDELSKIVRAVEKQTPVSEVLLVLDATMGQNAIAQAKAFTEVARVTGVVLTKLDGSAKGGIAYAVQQQLDVPVKLVGTGEKADDFAFFSPVEFATGLVAN
jgi:fused signal recognition particle receptor